jgi:putative ABC transport system permease protein
MPDPMVTNLTGDHGSIELDWEGKTPGQHMDFANIEVGDGFIETMGIEFKEGHSPSMNINPESQIILNEEAIRIMGLKDAVGKKIHYWGIESEIVGVAKNFNFESLHEPIKPSFFRVYPISPYFIVKIQGGTEKKTIQLIQQLYNSFASGYPFDYKFLDENYNKLYAAEEKVSVLSRYFAVIAIVISCLGLLGLAAFTAERRIKEIGIRKVLGSSELGIVYLLSSEFTKVVFAAIVLALPVSFLMTKYWLSSFAFKVQLEWWYFIGPGLIALLVAWLTVGTQALRAAKTNPVDTLKSE